MDSKELSVSEYLKCNNACVKVKINRYSGLRLGTLREMRDGIPRLLKQLVDIPRPTNRHAAKCFEAFFIFMWMYFHFINYMLNQSEMAKDEKCEGFDLSSLTVVFRRIVCIKGIDQHADLLQRTCIHIIRLLEVLVKRYDPRHASLRFGRSLILHHVMFPDVIVAGKLLATLALKQPFTILPRLFKFTLQDFEPEEIHHGSGFLIADNLLITNKHVIGEAMSDETLEICILNETIGELPCVVVHCDATKDLALLYCHGLDLKQHGICPLALSKDALWPSLSVFSFGYPLTHTGTCALFAQGYVSGVNERYGREPFVVLNCVLNHGNSGGPVLRRIGDDIKVVGVVAQKHKKEILSLKEIKILEEERSILEEEDLSSEEECSILDEESINGAAESRDQFWRLLSLKLYDALNETHSQFGYGNMIPGHLVAEFLSHPTVTSIMDFLKEMELCIEMDEFDAQG